MALRSPRLNAILGASPEEVTYEQIVALKNQQAAAENEQLDYKKLYEPGSDGTQELAIDIATFANHLGGVIVVGMVEVNDVPTHIVGVKLSKAEPERIHKAVAARIFPQPRVRVRMLADPKTTGERIPTGIVLIIVEPSATTPHAVAEKDGCMRWPRRHGADKIWLTEGDIAAAYRRRFTAAADQASRLRSVEDDVYEKMQNIRTRPWPPPGAMLLVSLVPDIPGDLVVDQESLDRFRHEIAYMDTLIGGNRWPQVNKVAVGRRRFIAYCDSPVHAHAELHSDGAGCVGVQIAKEQLYLDMTRVWDNLVVVGVLAALRLLARHARDRAGAAGVATTSALLVPFGAHVSNGPSELGGDMELLTTSRMNPGHSVLGDGGSYTRGHADFLLDDLADGGRSLAAATARLTSDLFQGFNVVEPLQISREGVLREAAWGSDWAMVADWAAEESVPVDE